MATRPTYGPGWATTKAIDPAGTDPATSDVIAPTTAKRDNGWANDDPVPYETLNALLAELGEWSDYCGRSAGQFAIPADAIAALGVDDTCVINARDGTRKIADQIVYATADGAQGCVGAATDGRYLYTLEGDLNGGGTSSLTLNAYALTAAAGGGLATPVASVAVGATNTVNVTKLQCNGSHVAVGWDDGVNAARVELLSFDGVSFTDVWTFEEATSIRDVAMDGESIYVLLYDVAGDLCRRIDLDVASGGATVTSADQNWSVAPGGTLLANAVADGYILLAGGAGSAGAGEGQAFVYTNTSAGAAELVHTETFDGQARAACTDGSHMWLVVYEAAGTINAVLRGSLFPDASGASGGLLRVELAAGTRTNIEVDQRWVLVGEDSADELALFDKTDLVVRRFVVGGDANAVCSDGAHLYVGSSTRISKIHRGTRSAVWTRAGAGDIRPYQTLLIPEEGS